jgi:hypothetical protein
MANKGGRPKALENVDLDQVKLMGYFKATYETMAEYFQVSTRTIDRYMEYDHDKPETMTEFCRAYKNGLSNMKMKLSEAQLNTAIKDRNATMLIWLGKQHLGQRDLKDVDLNVSGKDKGIPIINWAESEKESDEK